MDDHTFTVENDEVGLGYCVIVQDGRRECVTSFGHKSSRAMDPARGSRMLDAQKKANKMTKPDKSNELGSFERPASSTQATPGIRRLVEQVLSKNDSR